MPLESLWLLESLATQLAGIRLTTADAIVPLQAPQLLELHAAGSTRVRRPHRVDQNVIFKGFGSPKARSAYFARIRSLAGVDLAVVIESSHAIESHAARLACERFFLTAVVETVRFEIGGSGELLAADLAGVRSFVRVNSQVLPDTALLREAFAANLARMIFLARMDAHVLPDVV